jgi:transposase-like protein
MAAPLKLADPRIRKSVLTKVKSGARVEDLCRRSGIGVSTLRRWLRDGEPPENPEEDPLTNGGWETDETVDTGRRKLTRKELQTLRLKRQFWQDYDEAEGHYLTSLDQDLRTMAKKEGFDKLLRYARLRFPHRYAEQTGSPVVQVNASTQNGDAVGLTFAQIAADALADEADPDEG